MHTLASTFVLGYHGCDRSIADRLLDGEDFRSSDNDYDWLGSGVYFWEANPRRGLEFAQQLKALRQSPPIKKPSVVGAVIDLGLCLDLTTAAGIAQVRDSHAELSRFSSATGWKLPVNSPDLMRRNLDCAVIGYLHKIREKKTLPRIDSVKGVFVEGKPIYAGSGFNEKTHVQICVRALDCIKGVFRVPERFLS